MSTVLHNLFPSCLEGPRRRTVLVVVVVEAGLRVGALRVVLTLVVALGVDRVGKGLLLGVVMRVGVPMVVVVLGVDRVGLGLLLGVAAVGGGVVITAATSFDLCSTWSN